MQRNILLSLVKSLGLALTFAESEKLKPKLAKFRIVKAQLVGN
jgi:hypothetical protein